MDLQDKLNSGHYLELMDRLHVVMCNINDHCIQHPVAKLNKNISTSLNKALEEIWDVYQEVGKLDYEKNNP
jgi:hypothetical protein